MSIANTLARSLAQVILLFVSRGFSTGFVSGSGWTGVLSWVTGTIRDRILECGARQPKNRVRWIRGGGTSAAESGAIEQDADMVCFVYRDEVYNKETEDKGVGELIVAKHRAGETATIRLAWLSRFTTFGNLDESSAGSPVVQLRPDQGDVFI